MPNRSLWDVFPAEKVLLVIFGSVFLLRLFLSYPFQPRPSLKPGDFVIIRSCLDSQPKTLFDQQYFWLAGVKISAPKQPTYSFGDCLRVEGRISSKRGGRGEVFYLEDPKIQEWQGVRLSKTFWLGLQKRMGMLREGLVGVYRRWLPEPEASLAAGVVLGAKSKLPGEFYEKLRRSGTLHIVVASGYNLTVISQKPVDWFAWFVGRRAALGLGWLLIWFYALLAGGDPPVIRAAIIISFVYLAQFLGKRFDVWRAYWAAVWLMLIIKPQLLISISFQLSAAAMFGLLVFSKKFERLRKIPFVGKELAETLSAQLMVLPIIAYHFGQVSWAAPLVNMFVLPLVPQLMGFGLAALSGVFWSPLSALFLYLAYPLLWVFVEFIRLVGSWPWLSFSFRFSWWLVGVYYLLLFFVFGGWGRADQREQEDSEKPREPGIQKLGSKP